VTELCSGQALADADTDADNDNDADTDAAAADTADKSNPYMSPFQGDTKTAKSVIHPTKCVNYYLNLKPFNFF
jgi:hypothetical protein